MRDVGFENVFQCDAICTYVSVNFINFVIQIEYIGTNPIVDAGPRCHDLMTWNSCIAVCAQGYNIYFLYHN